MVKEKTLYKDDEGRKMLIIDMKKSYKDFKLEVNFTADREVTVIVGPSGSGKSTILNCVAGVTSPDTGVISLNDEIFFDSYIEKTLPVHKRRIGYVFQSYALFPHINVYRNIKYGLNNYHLPSDNDQVYRFAEVFKIEKLLKKYPYQLSGGEKQRVALARSLIIKPKLLLLDEPFSALDNNTKQILYNEFLEIREEWNIPILMITHDEEEARYLGNRIIRISNGHMIDDTKV